MDLDSKQISEGKKATVLSKVQVRRSLRSLSFITTYATGSHIILSTSHAQIKENYNINGPPVKNTTSQLGADPPTKARWSIAVLGFFIQGLLLGLLWKTQTHRKPQMTSENVYMASCTPSCPCACLACPGASDQMPQDHRPLLCL